MKKLLALGLLSTLAVSAFGQGQVTFNNRLPAATPSSVVSPIYLLTVGGTLLSGTDTQFHAALLGGPTTLTAANVPSSRTNGAAGASSLGTLPMLISPSTAATWTTFRTGTTAGFLGVGTDSARETPGVAFGANGLFQVVAWNGGYNTWAQAYAAWAANTPGVLIGASNPLILPTSSSPTALDVPSLQGLESFAIVGQVPEPTTFALAGLGAAALMIFRRRK